MKAFAALILTCMLSLKSLACGWYSPEEEYYNLFLQEIIGDARYFPFLKTYDAFYYSSKNGVTSPNENIEAWQDHLDISYEQAYYLVFQVERQTILTLLDQKTSADPKLSFIDAAFIRQHKAALEYLSVAKYLEPYMAHKAGLNSGWGDQKYSAIESLSYPEITQTLIKAWKKNRDKGLKLRYGYQLVRFAHYSAAYDDALYFFQEYVESLNYRPIMYYYALDQRAGAQRALGQYMEANQGFFTFFTHTNNRKENAYTSMRVTQDLDFERLLMQAKTDQERNDLYLLLGFKDFNNPLSSIDQIIASDPDAIQAKVLMARAINQLERHFLQIQVYCPYYTGTECLLNTDHRLPLSLNDEGQLFLQSTLKTVQDQLNNPSLKDKNFWLLSLSYLHFLNKDFEGAQRALAQVKNEGSMYEKHLVKMHMLIDIAQAPRITPELEMRWVKTYPQVFQLDRIHSYDNSTEAFILDLLANRYFLQGDRVKAFLLQNNIDALESNMDMELLDGIEALYTQKSHTALEEILVQNITPYYAFYNYEKGSWKKIRQTDFDFQSYVAHMRGSFALRNADFKEALTQFKKVDPDFALWRVAQEYDPKQEKWVVQTQRSNDPLEFNGYDAIPAAIFGTSEAVCFECDATFVLNTDLLVHFPFIQDYMNKKELSEALVQLEQLGESQNPLAAEANLLVANFLFNSSTLGYFREVLSFNLDNGNDAKYRGYEQSYRRHFLPIYYKDYAMLPNYQDDFSLGLKYIEKALETSVDRALEARILFVGAQFEQGTYYQVQYQKDFEQKLEQEAGTSLNYSEMEQHKLAYKTKHYRTYFKALKVYSDTPYYQDIRSNCLWFDYYVTHF